MFHGPISRMWTSRSKRLWHVKERYSAQLRIEVYNIFNHINYAQVSNGAGGSPGALTARPRWRPAMLAPFGFSTGGQTAGWNIAEPAIPVRPEVNVLGRSKARQADDPTGYRSPRLGGR